MQCFLLILSKLHNKVGKKYGFLTVKKMLPNYKNGRTYCLCDCECGNETTVYSGNLREENPHTTSCGCKSSRNGTKQYDFLRQYRFDDGQKVYSVYKHTAPNGKCYIGITKQTIERRSQNGEGYNTQRVFYRAIQKYGWDNFKHEILAENLTHDEACKKEMYYIDLYKSNQNQFGYNVTAGGDGCANRGKKIAQIFNGKIVNVFPSISDASKKLKVSESAISDYAQDDKEHGGYKFKIISKEEYNEYMNNHVLNIECFKNFRENILKEKTDIIKKYNVSRRVRICKYSLEGKFIEIFNGINEAQSQTKISNISRALMSEYGQAGGYIWKYDNGDYSDIEPYKGNKHNEKIVKKLDKYSKDVLGIYQSLTEAEKDTGINFKQIWKSCNGQQKTAGGYIWKYAEESNFELTII